MSNKSLIIVESPTKARMIKKFLGGDYEVISSMGHIRDLPAKKFGVDIENNFKPIYEIIKGKEKILKLIKSAVKKSDKIYLAMDEDREGEAIGWHIVELLNIKDMSKVDRIVFHEVTEEAIRDALEDPRKLNKKLVDAQQLRRIIDRIVGYKISPLLSKKIRKGLSAGRVQSVGLEIIVEREKERNKFSAQKYYTVEGLVDISGKEVEVLLWGENGKKFKKLQLDNYGKVLSIIEKCLPAQLIVKEIVEKEKKLYPHPPFITSSLQQEAFNTLKFTPTKTMIIAQQLYEGIDLKDGSSQGLITYMRTDSVKIAKSAISSVRNFISKTIGKEYLPAKPNLYRSRKTAQEAHECIRPADIIKTPDKIEDSLTRDQFVLYELIWRKFISSQMKPALIKTLKVNLICAGYDFSIDASRILFDGYTKIWPTNIKEKEIPLLDVGKVFNWKTLKHIEHETKPPARFTPATLVKELEKNGIGRPSTYASIINTLYKRKYVVSDGGALVPEEIGIIVAGMMKKHFSTIVDKEFTSRMETNLDEVASGVKNPKEIIVDFYGEFKKQYDSALKNMKKIKDEETDIICTACGSKMIIRWGRNGKFLACSAFPKCKKTLNIDENGNMVKEDLLKFKCPKCSSPMVMKTGRYGKFLACSMYPTCKTTIAVDKDGNIIQIPLGYERCPDCGKNTAIKIGRRGKFLACSGYPKCKFSMSLKKKKNTTD